MSQYRRVRVLVVEAVLLSSPFDAMSARAEEPWRPRAGFLSIGDVSPMPEKPAMTADEQLKLKKQLIAVREGQARPGQGQGGRTGRLCEALNTRGL
jgi:hypothetical protein